MLIKNKLDNWKQMLMFYDVFPTYEDIIKRNDITEDEYNDLIQLFSSDDLFTDNIGKFKTKFYYVWKTEKERNRKAKLLIDESKWSTLGEEASATLYNFNDTKVDEEDKFKTNSTTNKRKKIVGFGTPVEVFKFVLYWKDPDYQMMINVVQQLRNVNQPNSEMEIIMEGDIDE